MGGGGTRPAAGAHAAKILRGPAACARGACAAFISCRTFRNRAGKYAVILDGLMRAKVKSGEVAARIKEMGGIEAAFEAMQTQARRCGRESSSRRCSGSR